MASARAKPPRAVSGFWQGGARGDASACRPDAATMSAPHAITAQPVTLGRLTRRGEFLRTRAGRSWASRSLVLQAHARRADDACGARFGFTATKRLGSAVRRNRARRRLKEAVRLIGPDCAQPGYDYVVIARRGTLTQAFSDIVKELETALRKVHKDPNRSAVRESRPARRDDLSPGDRT